ncbi:CGNR zinc finger domain-containing protein [Streptomyces bauhiniae]|uniref:CGNR zinc finger domain-containing protein n=1 Tax=Streptomyces bauhiniae TaxID=2340725 RepID=A0A7K3QSI9_9ACTN|nr:CGNR zinc finger domain-containing protein [Streptomyces bauhiniae]NEB92823.1 CGNR zinc finger domain-containing protein [Streptomyces bauhiniae]
MVLGTPRFDAGRRCLDLLATAYPEERIGTAGELAAWVVGAGLVPAGTPLGQADGVWVARFLELRRHTERLIRASRAPADSLDRINRTARAAAPPAVRAVDQQNGPLIRELAEVPTAAALLSLLARDAIDLLTDPLARAAVRECAGEGCPLLYLDTSRGRRRRWCSSEVCGNRERVARHRRRVALARS